MRYRVYVIVSLVICDQKLEREGKLEERYQMLCKWNIKNVWRFVK